MKLKLLPITIIMLIILLISISSATTITDSYNTSLTAISSYTNTATTSTDVVFISGIRFVNTSSISGVTQIKTTGLLVGAGCAPKIIAEGKKTFNTALAGLGDSYSKTRATGQLTISPISNISSYDAFGNPVYSGLATAVSIELNLDKPLTTISGDTTDFRLYNLTSNTYTWQGFEPSLYPGCGFTTRGAIGVPSTINYAGYFTTAENCPIMSGVFGIVGHDYSLMTTKYEYQFENIISINDDTLTYSIDKTITDKTTLSQVNITDGLNVPFYTPLGSSDISNTFIVTPINIWMKEPRFNTVFNRTYFLPEYIYSVTPSSINSLNEYVTGILSVNGVNPTNIKYFKISDITEDTNHPNFYNESNNYYYSYNFLKTGNQWFAYNLSSGYSVNMSPIYGYGVLPNNLRLYFKEGDTHSIRVTIIDNNDLYYYAYATVIVNTIGKYEHAWYPTDYVTGDFISGASVNIKDMQTNVWDNQTVYSLNDCWRLLNEGWYEVRANASGYENQNNGAQYINVNGESELITMYPSDYNPLSNLTASNIYINVRDDDTGGGIYQAVVQILPDNVNKYTGISGTSEFLNMSNETTYQLRVSKTGYSSISEYFTTNAYNYYLNVFLEKGTGAITLVPTTSIPTATPIPVFTPSGWINGTATVCVPQNMLPANTTIIGAMKNNLACFGLESAQTQSLGLAGLIVMIFILAGARYGKSMGAVLGSVVGFVLSLGAGLIPFWVFAALLVLLGLATALIIWAKSG